MPKGLTYKYAKMLNHGVMYEKDREQLLDLQKRGLDPVLVRDPSEEEVRMVYYGKGETQPDPYQHVAVRLMDDGTLQYKDTCAPGRPYLVRWHGASEPALIDTGRAHVHWTECRQCGLTRR